MNNNKNLKKNLKIALTKKKRNLLLCHLTGYYNIYNITYIIYIERAHILYILVMVTGDIIKWGKLEQTQK